jgi:putative transcriptional regulator
MIAPQTGTLLIAEPFLKDPNFMRTVVLMCRHTSEEGSFGFVLNKTFEKTLDELVPDLEDIEFPVYTGGPVQMDTLHYIHQYPEFFDDCQKIGENIYWGGDFETLKLLIKSKRIES